MTATAMWFSATAAGERSALAARLRRRDPDLLEALIAQYEYRLFRYLLCLTSNRTVAEDLFQETWMRVLDRGGQYNAEASFEAWLFTIARRLAIDFHRHSRFEVFDEATVEAAVGRGEASPYESVFRRERAAEVHDALGRLPAIHREVLVLRFQEDLPLAEIAAIIDAPLATVKSRLYRALDALRQELEHD